MVVDLGDQAASDHFPRLTDPLPDAVWPLELWLCSRCALVQLGPVAALVPEPVRAVESATSLSHAGSAVRSVLEAYPSLRGATVCEFASHHGGSWLEELAAAGCRVVDDGRPAELVIDVHGLAHETDLRGALELRAARMASGGLLMLEFHHLLPLVTQVQYDTIRHGHWSYLSLTALERLAADLGLKVVASTSEQVFGGSLRVTLTQAEADWPRAASADEVLHDESAAGVAEVSALRSFDVAVKASAAAVHSYLSEQRAAGRRVLAYGAPSKASVLLGVSDVGTDLLEFTVDASVAKHGLAVPRVRIPIRSVSELVAARPDVVFLLTWDIAEEVIASLEGAGGWGAEYVVPIPAPHRLTL
jgi:hypothetical protein